MGKQKQNRNNPMQNMAIFLSNLGQKVRSLLNPRAVKLITSLALVVTALVVFLIVFSALSQKSQARNRQRMETDYEKGLLGRSLGPGTSDLLLSEDFPRPERNIYLYREPKKFWSDDEVAGYWIDLSQIVLDEFAQSNRDLVRNKLDEVP